MRHTRYSGAIISLVLVIALVLPAVVYADRSNSGSEGSTVEIVKKTGAKGVALADGWPPSSGPLPFASTGLLGKPVTGQRYAILVGISDYPGVGTVLSGGYDLLYADNDAVGMASVLVGAYGFDPANVTLLMGPQDIGGDIVATRNNILDAIEAVKDVAEPGDEVVFQFSGHGAKRMPLTPSQGGGQVGITVLGDTDSGFDFIWDSELKEAFEGFKTSRIVFIFDTCLAGGMINIGRPGNVVLMATSQNGTAYEFGPAYVEAYSIQVPPETPGLENGLFTYMLLAGLTSAGDPATLGVSIEAAYDFARFSLEYLSDVYQGLFWQVPTISDRFRGDLAL